MYPNSITNVPAPRACCARFDSQDGVSGQLVPAARIDGAECARAVQVRRRRRRCSAPRGATGAECGASACGLTVDAQGGGQQAAARRGGGGGGGSYLCSTPSSCDGVECVFAFPAGGRRAIGRVGARRFDAAGACVVQAPEDGCHKQQQQRQEAAHVDAAAARSVVMPLSRAAAVCVPQPCHL